MKVSAFENPGKYSRLGLVSGLCSEDSWWPAKVLAVDDAEECLEMLQSLLEEPQWKLRVTSKPQQAIAVAREFAPDIILMDIRMPGEDGYRICKRLKEDSNLRNVPVIFLSGIKEMGEKVRAFDCGGVDFVAKPFHLEEILARIRTHLRMRRMQEALEQNNQQLENLVNLKVKEITQSQMALLFALARLVEARDGGTGEHIEAVQSLCLLMARELVRRGYGVECLAGDFISNLYHASAMHDIGKVAIPDAILMKPGKLTEEEFSMIRAHTTIGAQTLQEVEDRFPGNGMVRMAITLARHHHERWDGAGYPDGLAGEAIPIEARMMSLVDTYETLRSKRCYKAAVGHDETVEIIRREAGKQFDPLMVRIFLEEADEFKKVWENEHAVSHKD